MPFGSRVETSTQRRTAGETGEADETGHPGGLGEAETRLTDERRVRREHVLPIGLITALVVVGNALYLVGAFDPNPIGQLSQMAVSSTPGLFRGLNSIDPNSGFTAQALGHRAVADWISGHVPWWNPFEGLGAPLAGEMQAAAFFPLTILLFFSNGQLYFHMILEVTAGVTTYLLLRRFLHSQWAATIGGALFALNGTFASIQHAPVNAIAFLPMLLLGIEIARQSAQRDRRGGWALIAIALALSIYAGFPEMSFINGLLALIWLGARCRRLGQQALRSYLRKSLAGGGVGVLLSAPIIVAFLGYLPYADIGAHAGGFGDASFPIVALPRVMFPYIFGPLTGFNSYDHTGTLPTVWLEGSLSVSLVALAAVGIFGREHRVLRLCLVGWIILAMGKTFGFAPASEILNLLPGVTDTAFPSFATVSWEFAVVVLAAFGVDDLVSGNQKKRWVLIALGGTFVFAVVGVHTAVPLVRQLVSAPHAQTWEEASILWGLVIFVAVSAIALLVQSRNRAVPLATVLLLEATVLFVVPELSAPRNVTIDTGPVNYLQQHAGLSRFFTFGTIQPNYGSYFAVSSVAANDVPIPRLWARFIVRKLDSNVSPLIFTGATQLDQLGPNSIEEFFRNITEYEAISVKYLVVPDGIALPHGPQTESLRVVFHDRLARILELPDAAPFYRANGSACTFRDETVGAVTLGCSEATTLVRQELFMPGWSATVNGRPTRVQVSADLVQAIHVRRGINNVTFSYQPPFATWAIAGLLAGIVLLLAGPVTASRVARARRRRVGE